MKARRVTIYRDRKGEYRYRVQAANWRVVEAAEEGFTRKPLSRIAKKYPGVEIVDLT